MEERLALIALIGFLSIVWVGTSHLTPVERPPDSVKAKQGSLKCTPGILRPDTFPPIHSSPRDKTLPISEQRPLMERF
ncbi:hypothetical protein XELAEV_18043270mg [Xenopus laevis]|uniref:Uncharacterized protein n=1 Tax=Xenopus laevis TaxID=8355 RepID=A0A974BWR1_XENLA|nr:hypothetical protein XELAEV_18043270mg [Xenopus laevis]